MPAWGSSHWGSYRDLTPEWTLWSGLRKLRSKSEKISFLQLRGRQFPHQGSPPPAVSRKQGGLARRLVSLWATLSFSVRQVGLDGFWALFQ